MNAVPLHIDRLFFIIDFLAVFAGAVGGALAAVRDVRYKYDLVGVTGLALVTALGGGVTRDLILQHGPPLAFADARYLVFAMAGAAAGMVFAPRIGRNTQRAIVLGMVFAPRMGRNTQRAIVLVDAAALGLFAVAGSTRALDGGLGSLSAFMLGTITAVGGGVIRDVLSGRTPQIFEGGEIYAIAAGFGAAAFLVCDRLHFPRETSTVIGSLCGFALRLLALRFRWQTRPVRNTS